MSSNGRFRKKKNNFTIVSNNVLKNTKLSLKAKGLYSVIQSQITKEDNFTLYKSFLLKLNTDGEKAFNSAWKELQEEGYLIAYKLQDEKGIFYYEYELLDEPIHHEIDDTDNKKSVKKTNKKSNDKNIERATSKSNSEVIQTSLSQAWKKQAWKRGVYNNTKLNNTKLNNTTINHHHINNTLSVKNNNDILIDDEMKNVEEVITKNFKIELSANELKIICIELKKNNKSIIELENICNNILSTNKEIKNLIAYIIKSIKNNSTNKEFKNVTSNNSNRATTNSKNNDLKFKNFDERTYDYDNLEKQLLGWDK